MDIAGISSTTRIAGDDRHGVAQAIIAPSAVGRPIRMASNITTRMVIRTATPMVIIRNRRSSMPRRNHHQG